MAYEEPARSRRRRTGMRPHAGVGAALLLAIVAAACSSTSGRATADPAMGRGSTPTSLASTLAGRTIRPPVGWKTVWYHGLGADVPAGWTVAPGDNFVCTFGATPIAYLGPTHVFYPCAMPAPGDAGNDGLWIDASYGSPGMIETSRHGIAVDIGLAADPTIAHQIEASLRYDPSVPDSPTWVTDK
jgi:hypothetical protein